MSAQSGEDCVGDRYLRAMRGHVYVADTIRVVLDTVAARISHLGPRPTVLELGSHAGFITEALIQRCAEIDTHVVDEDTELVEAARRRLAGQSVAFYETTQDCSRLQVDVVISVARHHHLPHDYLPQVRRLLKPGGIYILADELCPEYCPVEHAGRIRDAEVIHVAGGYTLTSDEEALAFRAAGEVPLYALELERRRKRALWHWYRFVVDRAVERGYFDVAAGELQSAADDLLTGSDAEHKFSALIVERQLALAGFAALSKRVIGPPDQPELQSMHVFEFRRGWSD